MAIIEVPEGCALELGAVKHDTIGSIDVSVECACGEYRRVLYDLPIAAVEAQARGVWLREHLQRRNEDDGPTPDA